MLRKAGRVAAKESTKADTDLSKMSASSHKNKALFFIVSNYSFIVYISI